MWRRAPSAPVFATDSAGYLGFAPIRTLGYPIFLSLVSAKGAFILQPVLFLAALTWLAIEIDAAFGSVLPAAAVMAGAMTTPAVAIVHTTILTESLFMSALLGFLALVVRFTRAPSLGAAAAASALAGAAAAIRPTGLALLAVLAAMTATGWTRSAKPRWKAVAAAALPFVAIVATERVAARAIHGAEATTLAGRHLFAKAALLDADGERSFDDPLRARLQRRLDADYAPIRRFLETTPADVRPVLALYYESCLQGPCVPELGVSLPWGGARINAALRDVALARIARAPAAFARQTAANYRSLWSGEKLRHPATAAALNAFFASPRRLPFEREAFALNPGDPQRFDADETVRFVQPLMIAMGWVTGVFAIAGLAAAARRRPLPTPAAIACLASLTVHACLLLSALSAPGLGRFIVGVWPAATTAAVACAWTAGGYFTWNSSVTPET